MVEDSETLKTRKSYDFAELWRAELRCRRAIQSKDTTRASAGGDATPSREVASVASIIYCDYCEPAAVLLAGPEFTVRRVGKENVIR